MKIARLKNKEGVPFIAAIHGDHAFDLSRDGRPRTIADAMVELDRGRWGQRNPEAEPIPLAEATLLAPIDPDARVLCAGFNYHNHAAETAREMPAHPNFFMRFASGLVGPGEPILVPQASEQLDWEGEIAFVIKRGGRAIPAAQALEHVGGYVPFGDHSVRDFQFHGAQATAGKNFDQTGAIGPWITTTEEVASLSGLELFTRLNGEQVQHGRLADLIFDVPTLIAYISTFMTIRPGDVVSTGTPAGVGARRDPPRWLRAGEEISVEVPGLGTLSNPVMSEGGSR